MADFEIKNCPMCGSTALLDYDGVVDIYNIPWQNTSIECERCKMSLTLDCAYEDFEVGINESLITCWNSLRHKKPGKKFKIELSKDEIDLIMPVLIELKDNFYKKYKDDDSRNRFIAWNGHDIEEIISHINKKKGSK